ncbi:MAG: glycosyltransferase family 4 protein [Bryobacteraceae bacterium]
MSGRKITGLNVAWHWFVMGPYHFARMRALGEVPGVNLTVIESCARDDHGWVRATDGVNLLTLDSTVLSNNVLERTTAALRQALNKCRPDIIIASGYAEPHSLRVMVEHRAARPNCRLLMWSESTAVDHPRDWLRERFKGLFVSMFDGALVAGTPHERYLAHLGMPVSRIGVVGNCVENDHFASGLTPHQPKGAGLRIRNYFLFVGRFIAEKNLFRLIHAYEKYQHRAGKEAWSLVLVGTGPLEPQLRAEVGRRRIRGVIFAGLRQVNELPGYYARASCFVLPSLSEPWGLVVNEAMASGVPVLVSDRCGCAADLIKQGENGFTFDPEDVPGLADVMTKVSTWSADLPALGKRGQEIIAGFTPRLFAQRTAEHLSFIMSCGHEVTSPVRLRVAAAGAHLWGWAARWRTVQRSDLS